MTDTTQLNLSVQGKKFAGKSSFAAKVLKPAIAALGGTISSESDTKNGVFLTVALPLGALAQAAPPAEMRGPVDFAVQLPTIAPTTGLTDLSGETMKALQDLLRRRDVAQASLMEGQASTFINGPKFVPAESMAALLAECATRELLEIDSTLKHMGFRFVPAEKR